ncbi:hypothetical protein J7E70_26905 [Variovorax paradoxus]|nr:hypothetical protein [Variovorax paradoxus]MBT2304071.1 hypothetical protein [Variovorax paradoxus]
MVPLAVVSSLMMMAPLMFSVAPMSLGWERWKVRRLAAALTVLLGVLVIVRPEDGIASLPAWGIASALLCAVLLGARACDPAPSLECAVWLVALVAAMAVCLREGVLGLVERWPPLDPEAVGREMLQTPSGVSRAGLILQTMSGEFGVRAIDQTAVGECGL